MRGRPFHMRSRCHKLERLFISRKVISETNYESHSKTLQKCQKLKYLISSTDRDKYDG